MTKVLREYLLSFEILSEEDIDLLEGKIQKVELKKDEYYIKEGSVCKSVAFVVSGIFRSFYATSNEEETTYCFRFENTFLSAYSSFLTQNKSVENIQALSDSVLLVIPRAEILKLEEKSRNWLRFFKIMTEQEYIDMEKRIFLLQKESAEKRYKDLLQNQPEYLQLIPLNYLASYLGITQRHLSRIRKSISN